jgi:gelsolin
LTDESGSAAYFTVNIDDMLNGKPVQHRETQGAESQLFRSHFKSITYLTGGCDSGFKTVEPTSYKPRLLLVKGTMANVRVSQIPLESAAINHGDVFILGMLDGNDTWCWRYVGLLDFDTLSSDKMLLFVLFIM